MTEEEFAEEYADRARIVDENTRAGDDCISLVQDYEGNIIDIHQRIKTTFLAGYNKANEWHYVKDELPDHNGQFYVALKGLTETFILNYDYDEYDESKMVWLDDDDTNFDDEVYAWREKLKAPKESE